MSNRSFLLAMPFLMFALSVGGTSPAPPAQVHLDWAPTQSQITRWRDWEESRIGLVCVSLKAALPDGAGLCTLRVIHEEWTSGSAPPLQVTPAAELGHRGTWRGIPYQEVLLHPVQTSSAAGARPVLMHFVADVLFEAGSGKAEGGKGTAAPARRRLFVNPTDAATSGPEVPRPVASASLSAPPRSSAKALRISVSQDGIYLVDFDYLRAHGQDLTGVPAANLHVVSRGIEIPIVVTGPAKKNFGAKNAVLFYGQKLSIHDRPIFQGGDLTDTNVYWLYADSSAGRRMSRTDVAHSGSAPLVATFTDTVHAEVNSLYKVVDHFRPDGDNWFWALQYTLAGGPSQSYAYTVSLPHASGGNASLACVLAGVGGTDHAVSSKLNGLSPDGGPDPWTWSGQALTTATWSFSSGPVPGDNTIELTLPGSASQSDFQYMDYIDVSYERTFEADSGALHFTAPATKARYKSSGYSSPPTILDLSSMDTATGLSEPVLLKGASFKRGTVTFNMPADGNCDPTVCMRTVALSSSPLAPDDAQLSSGVNLSDPSLAADLLVITHPDFHPAGQDPEWEAFLSMRRQNLDVTVVDIQDVYDNFSYGIFDPTAIRSFLAAAASTWSKAPRYVLLIGDGTYDYKNYRNVSPFADRVPTMMFEDLGDYDYVGQYPSDAWYADVDGDGYPDMAVGRLPAHDYGELAGILGKIAAYEDQTPSGTWDKTVLYVADTYTEDWEKEFEIFDDHLCATYTPPPWVCEKVYYHEPPFNGTDADACAAAIRADWPCALVHYDGHAGFTFWGARPIFTAYPSRDCTSTGCQYSDIDLLPPISANAAPLPFVLNSACYVSGFDEVGAPSLMEALENRPDRGSIGSIGFSTIAYTDEEETFNGTIFGQIFTPQGERASGEIAEAARFSLPAQDARSVMGAVLLGDPTQHLRIPQNP